MLLRIINGFSQAAIIILALVLIVTITNKHSSNMALEEFQNQVNQRFDEDKKYFDGKIKMVQDNLNTYQQTREARAQLYSKRLDELYDVYKKDPTPIDNANSTPSASKVVVSVDNNLPYLETKINNLSEKVDNIDNRLTNKISVLEKKIDSISYDSKSSQRVINNNINNVGNLSTKAE